MFLVNITDFQGPFAHFILFFDFQSTGKLLIQIKYKLLKSLKCKSEEGRQIPDEIKSPKFLYLPTSFLLEQLFGFMAQDEDLSIKYLSLAFRVILT